MKTMLAEHYGIIATYPPNSDNQELLMDDEYVYHIIRVENKEVMYMEQAALSWLLYEQGSWYVGRVMPDLQGNWMTVYNGETYCVMQANARQTPVYTSHGEALAAFHQWGSVIDYEPQSISSYGLWKPLWINKLEQYEQAIIQLSSKSDSLYVNQLLDILPYMIGISENAIQYVQESESEWRMNAYDYGTVVLKRYTNQSLAPVIWPHELMFDHGMRDVAEAIRYYWLFDDDEGEKRAVQLIHDYQLSRPLSALAWRSLYARLVMPLHLLDVIGEGLLMDDHEKGLDKLQTYLTYQPAYEAKLKRFFTQDNEDIRGMGLPVIQWM